jgi:hypothetical protein
MAKYGFPFVPESFYQQEYELSHVRENVEMFLYAVVSVSLPFILGHQQLLVGAIVNAMLVMAALNLTGRRLLPIIVLPSIGAYFAGMLFGASSIALLYLMPFIWIGNALLALSIKELCLAKKQNRVLSLAQGAMWKTAFLFASAFALYSFGLIPAQFLVAMGVFQLATALLGGGAALVFQEGKRRFVAS